MGYELRISGFHYKSLREHLFPGDGLEAVAFALCGRTPTRNGRILTVHRIAVIPHDQCVRTPVSVTWRTEALASLLDDASREGLALVKFHSHPTAYEKFSRLDDISDAECFAAISSWLDDYDQPHGSAVMLPDGRIFGRVGVDSWESFSVLSVAGDELLFWHSTPDPVDDSEELEAQMQLFGPGTISKLRRLAIAVVGCSGTGSFVVELLARLGVGRLVLVDSDRVETRNLNRIVNSRSGNIGEYKVDVLKREIESFGLGTVVVAVAKNLYHPEAVREVSRCDVVFGCMDTAEGRHLLNKIGTFHLIPYFDLGVHLAADGTGGIDEASGVVHYIQPGGSSLLDRKAYTMSQVQVEGLYRTDPTQYKEEVKAGYIQGVAVRSPAVASLNATIAGIAVNEFLSRLHPFRSCDRLFEQDLAKGAKHEYQRIIDSLKVYADACLYFKERRQLFHETRKFRRKLRLQMKEALAAFPALAERLGIDGTKSFEVHELRRASKIGANGFHVPQVILSLTQSQQVRQDKTRQTPAHQFRGGSTLILDLPESSIRYRIVKDIRCEHRREMTSRFHASNGSDPLRRLFIGDSSPEPFAVLHALTDES